MNLNANKMISISIPSGGWSFPLQNHWRNGQPLTCDCCWQFAADWCDGVKTECSCQDLRLAQMDTFRVLSTSDMGTKLKRHCLHSPQSGARGGKVFDLRHWIECMASRAFQTPFYFPLFHASSQGSTSCRAAYGLYLWGCCKSFGWLYERPTSHLVLTWLSKLFRISTKTHPWQDSEGGGEFQSSLRWPIVSCAAWLLPRFGM